MKAVFLYPKTTFRTELQSDTLWGMLCWGIRWVYGNEALENMLKTYDSGNTPTFRISSAFPFIERQGERNLYFPRPILPASKREVTENETSEDKAEKIKGMKDRKKLKDISFIPQSTFEEIANGRLFGKALNEHLLSGIAEVPEYRADSVTHNQISRFTNSTFKEDENTAGQLFHVEEKYLGIKNLNGNTDLEEEDKKENKDKPKVGLYFFIEGETEKVEAALRYLCQVGMSGDSSSGKGVFEFKVEEINLSLPQNPTAMTNLSLYYPQETELESYKNNPFFHYLLAERKGKISGVQGIYEKKLTIMFAEGSLFPYNNTNIIGQNKIVQAKGDKLPHNVYQYGYALMLPLALKNE